MTADAQDENLSPQESPADCSVGYASPPLHSRFPAGRSGNPRGRPKGSRNFKTILAAAMHEKVTIRTAKGPKKITKLEALIQKTINDALTGDVRSTRIMLDMLARAGLDSEVGDAIDTVSARDLSEEDRMILSRCLGSPEPNSAKLMTDMAGADG